MIPSLIIRDSLPSIQSLFQPAPGTAYLHSATYGLPPTPIVNALADALHRLQTEEADRIGE
jgi:hypothetical protein